MDAALVRLDGPTQCELLAFATRSYRPAERQELEQALESSGPSALARLHVALGEWAAEAVEEVLSRGRARASDLSFLAFHGQTIWHQPPVVSWQLGEPAVLAERFGVPVIANFRARDVAAGGQGAPLVPVADVLLFGNPEAPRVLLNLGGMANLTYVRRRAMEDGAFAFDTGPGVAVLDAVARLVDSSLPYDRDGRLARRGKVHEDLVADLLQDPFFAAEPPKSTGRERFGRPYAELLHARAPGPDGVATAVALTARSVAGAIARWVPERPEIVVSGGGTHHPELMERLAQALEGAWDQVPRITLFDQLFFPGDAKEAVAFALLGYLTLHGQPGNLPAATGARGARVLGCVTPP
jgi:anhydro-N-acetylmuramic acid kinase